MSQYPAVKEALDLYRCHENLNREGKVNAAMSLMEWGVFSNRHIASFSGLSPSYVNGLSKKGDHSGGRLDPEALPLVIDLIHAANRGEHSYRAVAKALDAGISGHMLARLTGRPQSTLARQARTARKMMTS